jgi:hypothetical protein
MSIILLNKEIVSGVLDHFSGPFTIDELVDHVIIAAKLDQALEQLDKGEYLTEDELDEEIRKWN